MFFKRTTAKSIAVIDAYQAVAARLAGPEDAVAQAAFAGIAQAALDRHGTRSFRALPRRIVRDLACVLVLVHDDRPSLDHALVMVGIPLDDLVWLRGRAARRPDLVAQVRFAMRIALAEVRAVRRAARAAALATAAGAGAFEDPLEDILLAPEAGRLAA